MLVHGALLSRFRSLNQAGLPRVGSGHIFWVVSGFPGVRSCTETESLQAPFPPVTSHL